MVERARIGSESTSEEVGAMIVWSKGLGRQSLPIELDKAELRVEKECICADGIIEPVWWQYTITLTALDLMHFLSMLRNTKTASFVAREKGVFWLFMGRLAKFVPKVLAGIIKARTVNLFSRQRQGV